MSINFILIGQRVREYRSEKNLRQEDLAWNAAVSPSYLSSIENGAKKASLRAIIRIAEALNVTVDTLLFGETACVERNDFDELADIMNGCDETECNLILATVIGTASALKQCLRENGKKRIQRK